MACRYETTHSKLGRSVTHELTFALLASAALVRSQRLYCSAARTMQSCPRLVRCVLRSLPHIWSAWTSTYCSAYSSPVLQGGGVLFTLLQVGVYV